MERLIGFFVHRPMVVHICVVAVVLVGLLQVRQAARETYPDTTVPILTVRAILPGASARDVETKLAIPIQEAVEELSGVKDFDTVINDGTSVTSIELHDEFDETRIREAERDLKVLLDAIQDFPPEMEDVPTISRLNPKLFPVVEVALAGPSEAVREAARDLERRLRALDETSRIALVGLEDPEIRIYVDPVRARENSVTLLEVIEAVRRRNVSATGGMLESPEDRRQVVLWSRFASPEEVAQTVIRFEAGGGTLTVADVARIELAQEDKGLIAHTNGEPGVSLVILKQEDADILEAVDAISRELETSPLPPGVSYVLVHDTSFLTRNRLQLILNNGALGAALVISVLLVFLTPVAAGWTLLGIPIVFLCSLALFPAFDFSINMVTLTGLVVVLGMTVDDAVVVSERIVSRRQSGEERHRAAIAGAQEMLRPVSASALTTMIAFLPLWSVGGMNGKMIAALPAVVILTLCLSVIESFTLLPAHMAMGRRIGAGRKRDFMLRWEAAYANLLRRALNRRAWVVGAYGAGLMVILLFVAPRLPVMLFPQDDSEAAFIKVTMPLGTPIEQTEAAVAALERQLPDLMGSDLLAVTARIGHQEPMDLERTQGSAENEAVITALVQPVGRRHTSTEWLEIFQRELRVPAGARLFFEAEFMGPPAGRPVTVHVSSNDHETRRSAALEVAQWLRAQQGLLSIEIDERPGTPQIELALDYPRLALRGLDPQDVASTLQAAFHGVVASEHRELEETTEFRVILEPSSRSSLDALLEVPVRSQRGDLVKLRDVLAPVEVPAVSRIYHRNGRRTATIHAGLTPNSPHTPLSFAQKLDEELFPRFAGTPGLEVYVGGEAVETRKTTGDMGSAALVSVVGIGLVIALMLGSLLEALFILGVIPCAVAGVMLAFYLHGAPLSMFALMGTIGLSGVVVNASIVMVDAIHRRQAEHGARDAATRRELLIEAVVSRLRPIIVTTLTTLGGVLPMAYGIGGHDAIVSPMSLALGWGLFFSTSVTLLLVPVLYSLANDLLNASASERSAAAREGQATLRQETGGTPPG